MDAFQGHVQKRITYQEELDPQFGRDIAASPGGQDIDRCIQCGTCSSTCPVSAWMEHSPRKIIALTRAGFKNEVLQSHTIWLCSSCYACTVDCPRGVSLTDIMYALKRRALQENACPKRFPLPVLATEFFDSVQRTGRSNEARVATRMYLKTAPLELLRQARLSLALLRRGRASFRKQRMAGGAAPMTRLLDHLHRAPNAPRAPQ